MARFKLHSRIISTGLAAAMALACMVSGAGARDTALQAEDLSTRPRTENEILARPDFDRYTQGNHQYNTGYFYETISFEFEGQQQNRRIYYYLADGLQIRDYFTVIALPEGVHTEEDVTSWLEERGWFDQADKMGEGLVILPAGENGWGSPELAETYLNTVLRASSYSNNGAYFSTYGCHYFVGYEGGAAGMELWAAENPLFVISQVYVDADADLGDRLAERGAMTYGSADTGGVDQSACYPDVERREVPVPTWFLGPADKGAVEYWKQANDCAASAEQDRIHGQVFWQDKAQSNAIATASTDVISQVAVQEQKTDRAEDIYGFLSTYTRYDNTSVYGNFLGYRLDHAQAVADGRLTICSNYRYQDPTTGITWTREYMVYQPANSREKYPEGAPVVLVHSGGTQPCSLFFDCSNWWQIADEYGFLLVFPHSTGILTTRWNEHTQGSETAPYDFGYTSELIDIAVDQFGADPGKVFITGQSMGCFYTNYCGSVLADKVTAVGGTSGLIITDMSAISTNGVAGQTATDAELLTSGIMPAHLILGEYDNFSFKLGPISEVEENSKFDSNGYFVGHNLSETYFAYPTLTYWVDRNGVGPFEDYTVLNPNDLTRNNRSSLLSLSDPGGKHGDRYTTYAWTNSQGIPLFEYTQSYGRNHNFAVSDYQLLWETWFSKWSRDMETGCRYYEGKEVRLFQDLDLGDWYYPYVCTLFEAGTLQGDEDGTIRGDGAATWGDVFQLMPELKETAQAGAEGAVITRRELAEAVADSYEVIPSANNSPFADIEDGDITALYEQGVFVGTVDPQGDRLFRGEDALTRGELCAVVCGARQLAG